MKKTQHDFLALRHLAVCTKTFFHFSNFFVFLKVLMKTEYFNTEFVFLRHKIQTDIKQKKSRNIHGKITIFQKYFWEICFWTGPDPALTFWVGPGLPTHVNSGSLYYSHTTWTVARPEEDDEEEEEEEREREEGLPVMAHGASGDCGSGNGDASGGWGHGGARCWLLFLLFPPLFFSVFFSLFFVLYFFSFSLSFPFFFFRSLDFPFLLCSTPLYL